MMIKNILFFLFTLLFIVLFSCKGQPSKTENTTKLSAPIKVEKSDYDPYFKDTEAVYLRNGPSSITRNIMEDSHGNIWFATWEGIMSFNPQLAENIDAKPFTNFMNKENLRRFHVFSLLKDQNEHLWFGTIRGGIYYYDPSVLLRPTATAFTNITKEDGLAGDMIGCITEDKAGNIWIGTATGISLYDPNYSSKNEGNRFRNFIMEGNEINSDINSIVEDKNGTFWFGTRGDVFCYDGKTFTNFYDIEQKHFGNVRSIIEDRNGNIWLGGNDGLWRYSPNEGAKSFTAFSKDFVGYIYEDSKGNIWTGSVEQGARDWTLTRYDARAMESGLNPSSRVHRQDGQIFGILEDSKGNIWFGHEQGACRFDPAIKLLDGIALNCFK